MSTNTPNLECRMYEAKCPEVDQAVMIQVKSMARSRANVSLLEYNNINGVILFSELSPRRIRSISSLIELGRIEPVMVLRVDKRIYLSKRRISEENIQACEERYNKSKLVHSIMRHVAATMRIDLKVSERKNKLLAERMAKLGRENEVRGDEDGEEEEDTGMGEIDVENSGHGITD